MTLSKFAKNRVVVWRLGQNRNSRRSPKCSKNRDSSVGIALGYGLEDRGFRVPFSAGAGNFSLRHRSQNLSGAHPASYLSLGAKRPGREADHSIPSSAEVKE
jgi:hypothetical protein